MLKTLIKLFGILAIGGSAAMAQAPIGATTLSGAITSSTTNVCLASGTGVVTPSLATGIQGSILLIEAESMRVTGAGNGTACFAVNRFGEGGSLAEPASPHATGAKVWVLGALVTTGDPSRPISTSVFLGNRPYAPMLPAATPSFAGGVADTSVTDVAGKTWFSSLSVDFNSLFTGACWLNGATAGTDSKIAAVWDENGVLLANTALAGTTDSGASSYQCAAFTTPVALLGPRHYFVGIQTTGTTDNFKAYTTGGAPTNYATGSQTGTYGTLPSLTITSSFTTAVGPRMLLYQ